MLVKNLNPWLVRRLVCDEPSRDTLVLNQFWSTLGVDSGCFQAVVKVNPVWRDGCLNVSHSLRNDPQGIERVSSIIIYLLRFTGAGELN